VGEDHTISHVTFICKTKNDKTHQEMR